MLYMREGCRLARWELNHNRTLAESPFTFQRCTLAEEGALKLCPPLAAIIWRPSGLRYRLKRPIPIVDVGNPHEGTFHDGIGKVDYPLAHRAAIESGSQF